jgi:hypothetical protein
MAHFPVVLVDANGEVSFDRDRSELKEYLDHAYDYPLHPNPIAGAYVVNTSEDARTLVNPLGMPLQQIAVVVDRVERRGEHQVIRYVAKRILDKHGTLDSLPIFHVEVTR